MALACVFVMVLLFYPCWHCSLQDSPATPAPLLPKSEERPLPSPEPKVIRGEAASYSVIPRFYVPKKRSMPGQTLEEKLVSPKLLPIALTHHDHDAAAVVGHHAAIPQGLIVKVFRRETPHQQGPNQPKRPPTPTGVRGQPDVTIAGVKVTVAPAMKRLTSFNCPLTSHRFLLLTLHCACL